MKALMKKAGMEFIVGERVRVWYASERKWKVATVRAMIWEPHASSCTYYQVRCEGKDNRRYYRPEELQPATLRRPRRRD